MCKKYRSRSDGRPAFSYALILALLFSGLPGARAQNAGPVSRTALLAGAGGGLFSIDRAGKAVPLWQGGSVEKILRAGNGWFIMGSGGIFRSEDLAVWEPRSRGLPEKTIKVFEGGVTSFLTVPQELKDLEVHPADPDIMVSAVNDRAFLTRNGGRSWESLGAPGYRANGNKAVAAASMPPARPGGPAELTVFLSHSIYGVFYLHPDAPGAAWTALNEGLEQLETTGNADEVADIAAAAEAGGTGPSAPEVYVSQTFRPRIYRLDWGARRFVPLWSGGLPFGTVDSLHPGARGIHFVREGGITEIPRNAAPPERVRRDLSDRILDAARKNGLRLNCAVIPGGREGAEAVILSELWLLHEGPAGPAAPAPSGSPAPSAAPRKAAGAGGREGLYLPVNHAMAPGSLAPYLDLLRERRLDMVVIDMKDDYGRLRFTPRNGELAKKGRVFRPLDIDALLKDLKGRGIYAVARIVVFKDPELARREGGRYALWDKRTGAPWAGYYDTRRQKAAPPAAPPPRPDLVTVLPDEDPAYEIVRTFYDETWVDPYAEEVWDYTAALGAELRDRGFDEIQFDYIRFPTDGENLGDLRCRWQDKGMDRESAIISFLRHVRSRIRGPLSVDIYGANGWYRTGARTGQEVELLSRYVDVICPMYYPSHFEQDFLAQDPPELRPYRIYAQGTRRTARIGRGRVIVRPYVQAFYLNVSYDRQYYNAGYVRLQAEGVRDAGAGGLTYWNNSGRYGDIPVFPCQAPPPLLSFVHGEHSAGPFTAQ
ncbi:MAG: putative glycoside hydrolase, partial [Treponema sp.]|nr:putative glycoside hydrolase [Treponema sp.]